MTHLDDSTLERLRGINIEVTVNSGGDVAYEAVLQALAPLGPSIRAVHRTEPTRPEPDWQPGRVYRIHEPETGAPEADRGAVDNRNLQRVSEVAAETGGTVQELFYAEEWRDVPPCPHKHPQYPHVACRFRGPHPEHRIELEDEIRTVVVWTT